MKYVKLTKRKYLGEGYVHFFVNQNGEFVVVESTKQEYDALNSKNPQNPTLEGCTWHHSAGGTIKVDTPTTILGDNEYCDYEDGYFLITKDENGKRNGGKVAKEKIVNDDVDLDTVWL